MDGNTNLCGQNPAVERVAARAGRLELNHYPSPVSTRLREAIAHHHGLDPSEVIVGNGSDEVIDFVTKAFVNPGEIVAFPSPTFVMYPFYARVNLAQIVQTPLARPGFELDAEALASCRGKVTFLASPNNPTGNAFPPDSIRALLGKAAGIVVLDEAYGDFCGQDWASQIREWDRLLVLRTFSKAHGLAGLRVGYAVGNADLIGALARVKPPFDVGTFAEEVALEALADPTFLRASVGAIRRERDRLSGDVAELGFRPCRSDANFILIEVEDGPGAREFLRSRKILTRDLSDFAGLEGYLRVTVGRPEENDRFVEALAEWKRCR